MRRDDLVEPVRQSLRRLPEPFAAHYGVRPAPPPEGTLDLTPVRQQLEQAQASLARIDALADALTDPYLISRVLIRREAVSSSAIEGTNSTLDELLRVEETEGSEAE